MNKYFSKLIIFIYYIIVLTITSSTNALLRFGNSVYEAEEKSNAIVRVVILRTDKQSITRFRCILKNGTGDFEEDSTFIIQFQPSSSSASCNFKINDDTIPELREIFPVTVSVEDGGEPFDVNSTSVIIIKENDDPNGCIAFDSFNNIDSITVNEPVANERKIITYNLTRFGGTLGEVYVNWKILKGINEPVPDIDPHAGVVYFAPRSTKASFHVNILPDDIPEALEIFTIQIYNASGGACLWSNSSEVELKINENDALIRFKESDITFDEPEIKKIEILRGIGLDGNRVGSVSEEVSVFYRTIPGSAESTMDYKKMTDKVIFERQTTKKEISIEVKSDEFPELQENFYLELFNASDGIILDKNKVLNITILKNDDPHGVISFADPGNHTYIVSEDQKDTLTLTLKRERGSFGQVSVSWFLKNTDEITTLPKFNTEKGEVIFGDKEVVKNITLSIIDDDVPSEAGRYSIVLNTTSGGARIATLSALSIVIRDSDNAYGEFYFSSEQPTIDLTTTPRLVKVFVSRSGGAFGSVLVLYQIKFFQNAMSSGNMDAVTNSFSSILMQEGSRTVIIEFQIKNDVFLSTSSYFIVSLQNVTLQEKTLVDPSSPVIRSHSDSIKINITSEFANGEIAFFQSPIDLNVEERSQNISLKLMRDGTASESTVFWQIKKQSSDFNSSDVVNDQGIVFFGIGDSSVDLLIQINDDDVPELDEMFIVSLVNVTGSGDKLRQGGTEATITIKENDDPQGFVEFASSGPLIINEGEVKSITLIREGGLLKHVLIEVEIINGSSDFSPVKAIAEFNVGESLYVFSVQPNNDNEPELAETFTMKLSPLSDGAKLGNKTSLKITVRESDNPYGLFSFEDIPSNLKQRTFESKEDAIKVSFNLVRSFGVFGEVNISWFVTNEDNSTNNITDVYPTMGNVYFDAGQATAMIDIFIANDTEPESDEVFLIKMSNMTNGGKTTSPSVASLTIVANDFPISLLPPVINIKEGETAVLNISIPKVFPVQIAVKVEMTSINGSTDDYFPFNKTVVINSGETVANLSIKTVNDSIPELMELFFVELVSSSGDTTIARSRMSSIIIEENDYAYGVFGFREKQKIGVKEGDNFSVIIDRQFGGYNRVSLIVDLVNKTEKVKPIKREIMFYENEFEKEVYFQVEDDQIPNLSEIYVLNISDIVGGAFIGFNSSMEVHVDSDDFPAGIFQINFNETDQFFEEDRNEFGLYNKGNISFERMFGSLYSAKLYWQIFPLEEDLQDFDIVNLIVKPTKAMNITYEVGRNLTLNVAANFSAGSLIESELSTSFFDIDGYVIGIWFKPVSSNLMSLLKVGEDDIELILDARFPSLPVLYYNFKNETADKVSSKVSLSGFVDVFDGQWHSIFVSHSYVNSTINIFADGKLISESIVLGQPTTNSTTAFIGNDNTQKSLQYYGQIQHVFVFNKSLSLITCQKLSSQEVGFNPWSGFVDFEKFVQNQSVMIETVDNDKPEGNEKYILKLLVAVDEAPIKYQSEVDRNLDSMQLTVLKSDYANGLFQLNNCLENMKEGDSHLFRVKRLRGLIGDVTLQWNIFSENETVIDDFTNSSGEVIFRNGEMEKNISVSVIDDQLPELLEVYTFNLSSVQIKSINRQPLLKSSSVGIGALFRQCTFTINESDYPYGVLQVMDHLPDTTKVIPPAIQASRIFVEEEIGFVHLFIVRAQGTKGKIGIEWQTKAVKALEGTDFQSAFGTAVMVDGQKYANISIKIIDDKLPELEKIFKVELQNPSGGAVSLGGREIIIEIKPSDDSLGTFSLYSFVTSIIEGGNVSILIQRSGGSLGSVFLRWYIDGGEDDFHPSFGLVEIGRGEMQMLINITCVDDKTPELAEKFNISIFNVTGGKISETNNSASITILPSDFVYGVFSFEKVAYETTEESSMLSVKIIRNRGHEAFVRLTIAIINGTALSKDDFNVNWNYVDFERGFVSRIMNITVIDDSIPEIDEYFMLKIVNVTLMDGNQAVPFENMIGVEDECNITILANDDAYGVLSFTSSVFTASENERSLISVERRGGTFGKISFAFAVESMTANLSSDFNVQSFTMTMNEGQDIVYLPITIIDDEDPEFNETFRVDILQETLTGGVTLNPNMASTLVVILENDFPYGVMGFSSLKPLTVMEPNSLRSIIHLEVSRSQGKSDITQIDWLIYDGNRSIISDIEPSSGTITFLTGSKSRNISLGILPDNIPEIDEVFTVELASVKSGSASIDYSQSKVNVTILANDNPHGKISFKQAVQPVDELTNINVVDVDIVRTGGLFGDLKVYYRTAEVSGETSRKATSNIDYISLLNNKNFIYMYNGESVGKISISILNDSVPELDEDFVLKLELVELVNTSSLMENQPALGDKETVIRILENDFPYGLFEITVDLRNVQMNNSKYFIYEPNEGSTTVTLTVERKMGLFSDVTVAWELSPPYTIEPVKDVNITKGNVLQFKQEERLKSFSIEVHSDDEPEDDETFNISLVNPTNGASVNYESSSLSFVILANDGIGGVIRFQRNSLSVSAKEGDVISLIVERSFPSLGQAVVSWRINGEGAKEDFNVIEGTLSFSSTDRSKIIQITALTDNSPEVNEEFQVVLTEVVTTGISLSGKATIDQLQSGAIITLDASDNPHGVFTFTKAGDVIRVDEDIGFISLMIVRKFGSVGSVSVNYMVQSTTMNGTFAAADTNKDVILNMSSIIFNDKQTLQPILIEIINDNIPEIDESFFVSISNTTLLSFDNVSTDTPKNDENNLVHVIINSNDGANGQLSFTPASANIELEEQDLIFNVTVERTLGTFGDIFCYYILLPTTAKDESDFKILTGFAGKLFFPNGENKANITVQIFDDNITEDEEIIQIGLRIFDPDENGGATLTKPDVCKITILPNDNAFGIIEFDIKSINVTINEPASQYSTVLSTYSFLVLRKIGTFGKVSVSWRINGENVTSNIQPTSGILTFDQYVNQRMFQVSVLPDDIPELDMVYKVDLSIISNNAKLGNLSSSYITIPANDYPYGLFRLQPHPQVFVDESHVFEKISVVRDKGTFGDVEISFSTQEGSATTSMSMSNITNLEFVYLINEETITTSVVFTFQNQQYVFFSNNQSVVLLRWEGSFMKVKRFPVENVFKLKTHQSDDQQFVFAATYERIFIYTFFENESISLYQVIEKERISDIAILESNKKFFLIATIDINKFGIDTLNLLCFEYTNGLFTEKQLPITTNNAQSVDVYYHHSNTFMVIGNRFNSFENTYVVASNIYTFDNTTERFQLHGSIQTNKVREMRFFEVDGSLYISVVNSNSCSVHKYNTSVRTNFIQEMKINSPCMRINKVHVFGEVMLIISMDRKPILYEYNKMKQIFQQTKIDLPFTSVFVQDVFNLVWGTTNEEMIFIQYDNIRYGISKFIKHGESDDFVHKSGTLMFREGTRQLDVFVTLIRDGLPELDESFLFSISNPTNGGVLSTNSKTKIVIMSNNNAYGRFMFAEMSRNVTAVEQNYESSVSLKIIREFGSFSKVILSYSVRQVSSREIYSVSRNQDIVPTTGTIEFKEGEKNQSLLLYIQDDNLPELKEVFEIHLLKADVVGSKNNEASINYLYNIATINIPANDNPYGKFGWSVETLVAYEKEKINSSVVLMLVRSHGLYETVNVTYQTENISTEFRKNERLAVENIDYEPVRSSVIFNTGETQKIIHINVFHDGNATFNEVFQVSITSVDLMNKSSDTNVKPVVDSEKQNLRIIIADIIENNGVIEFSSSRKTVGENSSEVKLNVLRHSGFDGIVGAHYTVIPINGSMEDIIIPENSYISFNPNETMKTIKISIVDDYIPELMEIIKISLSSPFGGAQIGKQSELSLEIQANDYPYGLISFQQNISSVSLTEGTMAFITVNRLQGIVGNIQVNWECDSDFSSDINPTKGVLTFPQGVLKRNIEFEVIDDEIAEVNETFMCRLTQASGGAALGHNIAIQLIIMANDKPFGVFLIDKLTRVLVGKEPEGLDKKYSQIVVRVLRDVGQVNNAEVSWRIDNVDESKPTNLPSATFDKTNGIIQFQSGVKENMINLNVLDDNIPEEASFFVLSLFNPTNGAQLSTPVNSTEVKITIAASDNPFGVFHLQRETGIILDEHAGDLTVFISRTKGFLGRIILLFNISQIKEIPDATDDIVPKNGEVIFNNGDSLSNISLTIINDNIPELRETFHLKINSIILQSPSLDFEESVNGIKINTPPQLLNDALNISIRENDNPYGTIEFAENKVIVNEDIGTAKIRLVRKGGLFGICNITFAYLAGTAKYLEDFKLRKNFVVVYEGSNSSYLEVDIINDQVPEGEESFQLNLLNMDCKSTFGNETKTTVVINLSNNPYGIIGFYKQQSFFVENPEKNMEKVSIPLIRLGGGFGRSLVKWDIIRVMESASLVTEDITPENGEVVYEDLQNGTSNINLFIVPYGGPQEREEVFLINITSIEGTAAIDENFRSARITIGKKGFPSGLFGFVGSIQPSDMIDEPLTNDGLTQISIPVRRRLGTDGNVVVYYSVQSIDQAPVINDVSLPLNTSIVFREGETLVNLIVNITGDDESELDEVFQVMLTSATNGGSIGLEQNRINFTIKANDNPFGKFFIDQSKQRFILDNTTLQRILRVTVERSGGNLGDVTLVLSISYEETLSRTEVVVMKKFKRLLTHDVKLPNNIYLAFGSSINVKITTAELSLISPIQPTIDITKSSTFLRIPEMFANSIVVMSNKFVVTDSGLSKISVTRSGLYGQVVVYWIGNVLSSSYGTIGVPGSLKQEAGNVTFEHGERTMSFSVEVVIPDIIEKAYVYGVFLSQFANVITARFGTSRNCIINPHGVIRIANYDLNVTVLEGKTTQITIERSYSVIGRLSVSYRTKIYSSGKFPAAPIEDFIELSNSVVFEEGDFKKDITITTVDDNAKPNAEQMERFYFELTLIRQLDEKLISNSPQIDQSKKQALISIQDNDDAYGIIAFSYTSINILESKGGFDVIIKRTGGKLVDISFDISTVGGGEEWSTSLLSSYDPASKFITLLKNRENPATASVDYIPIQKTLPFPKSASEKPQEQSVRVELVRDDIPEPNEGFGIVIHNVVGGATIFQPESYVFVNIDAEGSFNGEFGFRQMKASLDEDGSRYTTLTFGRDGTAVEDVKITWQAASSSISSNVLTQLVSTSGQLTVFANESESNIKLETLPDEIPELETWFYVNITSVSQGAVIEESRSFVNVTMLASDFPAGRFAFASDSRFPVKQLTDTELKLTVIRLNGSLVPASVAYETVTLPGPITDSEIRLNPAVENRDFDRKEGVLNFNSKQTEAFISIKLNPDQASSTAFPKSFNVTLKNPTNGASIHPHFTSSRVIITDKQTRGQFLKLRSTALNLPLTDSEIQSVLTRLLGAIETSSLDDDDQQITKGSIQTILDFKSSLPVGQRSLTVNAQKTLLDIFNTLLAPTRADTAGKSFWMQTFENAAYHLLSDLQCPSVVKHTRDNFRLELQRKNGSNVNGVSFSNDGNFLRFPVNMFPSGGVTTASSGDVTTDCTDLHFVELNTAQWFSDKNNILSGKVFSSAVKNPLNKNNRIVYRINAPSNRITQTGSTCVIWKYPSSSGDVKGQWSSADCKVLTQTQKYVECECAHMSEYAVLAKSDDRTGYEIYFYVSCCIVIGSCFLALLAFHLCSLEKTFTANLLTHFFFAVMIAEGIYVLAAYISPSLLTKPTHCSVLAMFLHYFYLSQFTTMFVQACNLWRILIMNDEHSYRRAIPFYLIAWGLPVIVVLGYIFVTHAVWDWSYNMMYSDVRGDGDMCFISNAYAAFSVAVIPVLLLILSVGVVFVQAYQVTPQWKYYDDIYRGRYNVKEVRHLMILFCSITIAWLFAGLHIAYGFLWLVIIFTVINCMLGAYILIVYVILRNQMRNTFSKKYEVRQPLDVPSPLIYDIPTPQQKKHPPDHIDWDNVELDHISHVTPIPGGSRRSMTPSSIKKHSVYGSPTLRASSSMRRHGNIIQGDVNESFDFDQEVEGTDFDDLIFALKTGDGYSAVSKDDSIHSINNNQDNIPPSRSAENLPPSRSASAADQYTIRKIQIGDTHL